MGIDSIDNAARGYSPGSPDQVSEMSHVLQSHPGVRGVAVLRSEQSGWVAFIEPNDTYLDEVLERNKARDLALHRWRKSFDLTQFTQSAKSNPVGLNIQGWNSSYTGQELPEAEMLEWVQLTVSEILGFAPRAAYEIGCGTGMLLLRVAPTCQRYVAIDFSPATLDRVRAQLKSVPTLERSVELLERMADDFNGFDQNSFDTVILNSVAQFFPSSSYLTQVLEGAIEIVRPGGRVFAGDIQSLPLRGPFLSSVELFRSDDDLTQTAIIDRILRRVRLEPWLFVSPAYFLKLARRHKKLSRVEIEPRLGRADNEVTRYRYNAILYVGEPSEQRNDFPFEDWRERRWDLKEIRELLEKQTGPFGIKSIPNSRVELDMAGLDELRRGDDSVTAGNLKRKLTQAATHGIHPQDLVDLVKSVGGLQIRLSWAACRRDGSYDAAFFHAHSLESSTSQSICWPQPEPSEYLTLTSWPRQSKLRSDLIEQISVLCKNSLPSELMPAGFYLVDTLPHEVDQLLVARAIDRLNSLG
jgi:SAM-dependent methyltransferase